MRFYISISPPTLPPPFLPSLPFSLSQVVSADMHGRGRFIDFYDPAEEDRKESLREGAKGGVKKATELDKEGDVVMGDEEEEEEVDREGGREGGVEVSSGGLGRRGI